MEACCLLVCSSWLALSADSSTDTDTQTDTQILIHTNIHTCSHTHQKEKYAATHTEMYTNEQAHTPSYTQIRHKDTNRFIYTETQTNMVTCTHRLKYILTTTTITTTKKPSPYNGKACPHQSLPATLLAEPPWPELSPSQCLECLSVLIYT